MRLALPPPPPPPSPNRLFCTFDACRQRDPGPGHHRAALWQQVSMLAGERSDQHVPAPSGIWAPAPAPAPVSEPAAAAEEAARRSPGVPGGSAPCPPPLTSPNSMHACPHTLEHAFLASPPPPQHGADAHQASHPHLNAQQRPVWIQQRRRPLLPGGWVGAPNHHVEVANLQAGAGWCWGG